MPGMNFYNTPILLTTLLLISTSTAFAQSRSASSVRASPATPVRQAALLDCPQTVISETVKTRLANGEQAQAEKSYYPKKFISPNAICVTRADKQSGTIKTTYNELSQLNQIPVRFEFLENGLAVYAGPKATTYQDKLPDMRCYSKTANNPSLSCTLYVDEEGGFTIGRTFGQDAPTLSLSVDPKILFGTEIKKANELTHYEVHYVTEGGNMLDMKTPDCEKEAWKNVVTQTLVGVGTIENQEVKVSKTLAFAGKQVPQYNIFGGGYNMDADVKLFVQTYSDADAAKDIVAHLMSYPVASVIFNRACEDPLRKDVSTNRLRFTSEILSKIGPKL